MIEELYYRYKFTTCNGEIDFKLTFISLNSVLLRALRAAVDIKKTDFIIKNLSLLNMEFDVDIYVYFHSRHLFVNVKGNSKSVNYSHKDYFYTILEKSFGDYSATIGENHV